MAVTIEDPFVGTISNLRWDVGFGAASGHNGFVWQWRDFVFLWDPDSQLMWAFSAEEPQGRQLTANEYWGANGVSSRWRQMRDVVGKSDVRGTQAQEETTVVDPIGDEVIGSEMLTPGDGSDTFDPPVDFGPDEQVVPGVIALSALARQSPAIAASVWWILRGIGFRLNFGRMISWSSLGALIKQVLIALGIAEGFDILVDWDGPGSDTGLIPINIRGSGGSGSGEDPVGTMVDAMTVSTWNANGVMFHRLSDGRLAVRNKHGVWKIWRPRKPIVIMPTGSANLQDLLRADAAIQKQAKKIQRVLKNRGWKVTRS